MSNTAWMPLVEGLKQALARRDRAAANAAVEQLLDSRARIGAHWHSISQLMQVSGELTLARRAIDAFVSEAGRTPQAMYAKVVLLTQSGRLGEAHDLLATLPKHVPDRAGHAYVLGNTAMTLGRSEEAREQLAIAVKARPGWGPAWLSLATSTNLAKDPIGDQLLADGAAAESRYAAANKDSPPLVEGDLFSPNFEGVTRFAIGACETDGTGGHCAALLTYDDGKADTKDKPLNWTDTVRLVKTPMGWRVDDIAYGGTWDFGNHGTLKAILRGAISNAGD